VATIALTLTAGLSFSERAAGITEFLKSLTGSIPKDVMTMPVLPAIE
jgi:hypothetical protein